MGEKWESDSLRWIHEVREKNYRRTKGKPLSRLPLGPSRKVQALARRLGLKRVPLLPNDKFPPERRIR